MSQNNDQGRPNPSQPWYDNGQTPQEKRFPFGAGDANTNQENTPPYGQPPMNAAPQAPQYPDQQYPDQPQYGQQGQQYGPPDQQQPQYGQQPDQTQHQPYPGQQPPQGQQASFQGILDPHTGEIHPVPDLDGLQDTDALLVVVSGPDSGSQILLDTDVVTVGRSPNADIFLDDVTVSRKHAEFVRTPSGFTLRDTGSLNGTYVGRQLIDSIELQNGADVQIGKFRMIFQQRPRS